MTSGWHDQNAKGCPSSPAHRGAHEDGHKSAKGELPRPPVFLPAGPTYTAAQLSASRAKSLLPPLDALATKSPAERLEIAKGYIAIMFEDGNTLAMIRSDGLWEVFNADNEEVKEFYAVVVTFVEQMIVMDSEAPAASAIMEWEDGEPESDGG